MDLTTQQLLKKAVALHASDIFIVAGRPASIRLNGSIIIENTERDARRHTPSSEADLSAGR